jgi:S1-C subfamily serine protease
MSLSVVSLGWVLVAARLGDNQVGRLTGPEQELWRRMEPAIATLVEHDRPVGAAALIDDTGLFVAAKTAVRTNTLTARLSSGQWTKMTVLKRDSVSGLVLLQADHWAEGDAHPFRSPTEQEPVGGRLLAVLGTGPIRAEFVTDKLYGIVGKSRRFVTLSEFRFEAPPQLIGTALVFCENGELIGTLNGALRKRDRGYALQPGNAGYGGAELPDIIGDGRPIGPSELTVAYTVGPDIVRQVINGFRSPSHEVLFPSLGVLCIDVPGGGAMIREIERGSAAQRAHLRVGDVIKDISGTIIGDQVDFAKAMNRQEVGAKITIRITRGYAVQLIDAIVGQVPSYDKE